LSGTVVLTEKWPVFARHERPAGWLQVWTDLGRAPRTINAYARGLAGYLEMCERDGIDPLAAGRADVARFVRELTERPSRRVALSYRSTRDQGWPMPRSSSGSCPCGCSTTF
jgi:hypothetical protein